MNRDLEVRHCRVLAAIDDNGGVAAAARALGLSQSTVSETLLSLERTLGAQITLRRPGKEALLTPAATALLPHARAVIAASEKALAAFAAENQEVIRLGTVESISSFVLPETLAAFRLHWPRTDVRISIGLCEELRGRVDRHDLDAALTIEGQHNVKGGSRKLCDADLTFVVSSHNSLAHQVVERAALSSKTFLLADSAGAFNGLLRDWFKNCALPRIESAGSTDGVKRGVRSSDSIGVLPGYALREELQSGVLIELHVRETLPKAAFALTARESAFATPSFNDFVGCLEKAVSPASAPKLA